MEEKRKCIICLTDKSVKDFNEEHIFPAALGGAISIYNVCKDCNFELGRIIDQPFLRHGMVAYYRNYFDLTRDEKKRKGYIPNPFKNSTITSPDGNTYRASFKDNKPFLEAIEKLSFEKNEVTGEMVAKLTLPASKIDDYESILKKLAKRQGYEITEYRIDSKKTVPNPGLTINFDTDNNAFILGCIKIAYEATAYFFPFYLEDELAALIGKILKSGEIDPTFKSNLYEHHKFLMNRYEEIFKSIEGLHLIHHVVLIENIKDIGLVCCIRIFNWFYPVIMSTKLKLLPEGYHIFVVNQAKERIFEHNLKHDFPAINLSLDMRGVSSGLNGRIRANWEREFRRQDGSMPVFNSKGDIQYKSPEEMGDKLMKNAAPYFKWYENTFNVNFTNASFWLESHSGEKVRIDKLNIKRRVIFEPVFYTEKEEIKKP